MNFNVHSDLEGKHAFLGASNYHWINYSEEKLANVFRNVMAKQKGTELHELACRCIKLGVKLPRTSQTLNMYVNDAIGFRMAPEQPLYYSENCFGTADTICFRKNTLRIHDLKTGSLPASRHQLEVYAALFCLEYNVNPNDIEIVLRIYQNDQILEWHPEIDEIERIIEKIVTFDKTIEKIKMEE